MELITYRRQSDILAKFIGALIVTWKEFKLLRTSELAENDENEIFPSKHMANFVVHPINCRFSEFVTAKVYQIREMMRDTRIPQEVRMLHISTAYAGLFNQISVLLLTNK